MFAESYEIICHFPFSISCVMSQHSKDLVLVNKEGLGTRTRTWYLKIGVDTYVDT